MSDTRNQTSKRPSVTRHFVMPLVATMLFGAVALLYGGRVYDYVAARMFTPTAEVAQIRAAIGLTSQGGDMFYASKPTIQPTEQFNTSCNSAERAAAILGCYYQGSIHIYDVTNPELAQAENVSAAHEMLHAAYERLNFIDRVRVDTMVEAEYERLKDDPGLQKLMDYYRQAEPDNLTNELHSIIGTTIAGLSPELEAYYQKYFTDRQKVVAMNKAYSDVFAGVEKRSDELSAKVDAMQPMITADLASYNTQLKQLDSEIESFNARSAGGYYSTRGAFSAARLLLTDRVDELNAFRSDINVRVAEYNGYVAELKALSVRVNELNSSINGIAEPEVTL